MVMQLKQRLISALAISLAGCTAWADDEPDFSGSYFCTADAAGGVRFNDATGTWESTQFKTDSRHILKLELWGKEFDEYSQKMRNAYIVSFSEHGANSERGCLSKTHELKEINVFLSFISENGRLSCETLFGDLKVNLNNGRYLRSFTFGYVEDFDNSGKTPAIIIGKCTRIN